MFLIKINNYLQHFKLIAALLMSAIIIVFSFLSINTQIKQNNDNTFSSIVCQPTIIPQNADTQNVNQIKNLNFQISPKHLFEQFLYFNKTIKFSLKTTSLSLSIYYVGKLSKSAIFIIFKNLRI